MKKQTWRLTAVSDPLHFCAALGSAVGYACLSGLLLTQRFTEYSFHPRGSCTD